MSYPLLSHGCYRISSIVGLLAGSLFKIRWIRSLGVIIYTLIIGKPPFETNDVKTTYKRIRMNNYSFPDSV